MNAITFLKTTQPIGAKALRLNLGRILTHADHTYRVMVRNKPVFALIPDADFMDMLEALQQLQQSGLLDKAAEMPRADSKSESRWFWTHRWQAAERAADKDIKARRLRRAKGSAGLFKQLDK